MNFVLFTGWVVIIIISADLIGFALRLPLSLIPWNQAPAAGHDHDKGGFDTPIDFAHSTLLGFATLWVSLSAAYAFGIATQQLILLVIGLSAVAAALVQSRYIFSWTRSRLKLWGLVGAIALLASFVTPHFNKWDDPAYLFLIDKLLETGSNVEYFSYRRPVTLGGWTFIQAIFSAGPAGIDFVASIDVVVGSVLFLICAFLLGVGARAALPVALCMVLVVEVYQTNLGTAISMAAMCAILVGLSLPVAAPRNSFTPIAFAVMACTIRPQLALIAIVLISVSLLRNRSKSLLSVIAMLTGITILWILIFLRDTSLLPLFILPGFNPQIADATDLFYQISLLSHILPLWRLEWPVISLTIFAVFICGWQSITKKQRAVVQQEFRLLFAFSNAAVATVIVLLVLDGPLAVDHSRYYIPVVEGFLYVFLIRSGVYIFGRGQGEFWKYTFLLIVIIVSVLSRASDLSPTNLSVPMASSGWICNQQKTWKNQHEFEQARGSEYRLLTPEERQAFERVHSGRGYTLLVLACPVGSFTASSRVMMSDLFFSTRGVPFDIAWDEEKAVSWLKQQGVDQLVYLQNDESMSYSLKRNRNLLKKFKAQSNAYRTWEFTYLVESLERFRELAEYCESLHISIRDPQGPLIIVNVAQCKG